MKRILLSVPHMGGNEETYVRQAFATNWLSTVGPNITALEKEFETRIGLPAVALSSGTAAIHLGLRLLGVTSSDEVFCPTLTFTASCNPVRYLGAEPVFLDSDCATWNLDPNILEEALRERASRNQLPRAIIVVHLYGQCADMEPILALCGRYEIPVMEDAAEALGATYHDRPAGTFGRIGVFSFNGNKIITTTGGGMLVSENQVWVDKARFWSQQARDPGLAYEHSEIGYNYRMSNVLAGIGRGQLEVLDLRVQQRRAIAYRYRDAFADLPGVSSNLGAALRTLLSSEYEDRPESAAVLVDWLASGVDAARDRRQFIAEGLRAAEKGWTRSSEALPAIASIAPIASIEAPPPREPPPIKTPGPASGKADGVRVAQAHVVAAPSRRRGIAASVALAVVLAVVGVGAMAALGRWRWIRLCDSRHD